METRFLRREGRFNVFVFTCPTCGADGEVGVPKDSGRLFGHGCGTLFIQQRPVGMYAEPRLVVVNGGGNRA
jgi:hypothetical protein